MSGVTGAAASDPALLLSLRWMLCALFVIAVVHKISSPAAFVGTVHTYRLLPSSLVAPFAYALIAGEGVAAVALLLNLRVGSVIATALLAMYTAAIAVNLWRGRRDIDCGCAGPYVRQSLSYGLVARNLLFLGAAAVTLLPAETGRALGALDWFTALAAAGTFALLFLAVNQLTAQDRGAT